MNLWVLKNTGIHITQKQSLATFYTGNWKAYEKVLPADRLVIGKEHTVAIEQNNSNVRHYLDRMTRRSKVASRSKEMLDLSLRLCWYLNEAGASERFAITFNYL